MSEQTAPASGSDCRMQEGPPGAWRCLVHDFDSFEWEVAAAMGAQLPCRIPLPDSDRRLLAQDEHICEGTAMLLVADPSRSVRSELVGNSGITTTVLVRLMRDPTFIVRRRVSAHPSVTPEILQPLATDPDSFVRESVVDSQVVSIPILERLATDPVSSVRTAAREELYVRRLLERNNSIRWPMYVDESSLVDVPAANQ